MSARIIAITIAFAAAIDVDAQSPTEAPKSTAAQARAAPSPEVIKAIDKGVFALRQAQYAEGCWGEYGAGSTALAMIALLEANVPTTDPAIIQAARFVRYESLRNSHTYSIACSIIALDRLGDVNDWQLINVLTKRLLNAQLTDGGWTYACKRGELGELEKTIPQPGSSGPGSASGPVARRDQAYSENPPGATSDNSNTQFAVLALWIGHRYDVDVDDGLRRAATRFRRTALIPAPGHVGWAYTTQDNQPTSGPSCCGLLGLALQHAISVQRRLKSAPDGKPGEVKPIPPRTDPLKDPMVQDAFRYVNAQFIAESRKKPEPSEHGNFYFLWSFERVAVAYGLDKTFGTDWYQLGVRRILPLQGANGMWTGYYGYEPETCFCLLFLCRSNLTPELVALLNPDKSAELRTDGTAPAPPRRRNPQRNNSSASLSMRPLRNAKSWWAISATAKVSTTRKRWPSSSPNSMASGPNHCATPWQHASRA